MKNVEKLVEIESLLENFLKKKRNGSFLRIKTLFFISIYENLSVGVIIDKLGIKKTNFALIIKNLEKEGLIEIKQAGLDKRCHLVNLTEEGRAEIERLKKELDVCLMPTSVEVDNAIEILCNYLNKIV